MEKFRNQNEKKKNILEIQIITETINTQEILECIERQENYKKVLGEGANAIVFGFIGSVYEEGCIKEIKDNPEIIFNSIEEESEFQKKLKEAGLRTPRILISFKDGDKKYLVMERIVGHSILDITRNPSLLPPRFNYEIFCKELDIQINKMHNSGVYHRDLHLGNIMIDEEGLPVIIDFGLATYGTGGEATYEDMVSKFNKIKKTYYPAEGTFKDDLEGAKEAKKELLKLISS